MATVKTTRTPAATPAATPAVTRPNLEIAGIATDNDGAPSALNLHLTVALEAVVADDADATVFDAYAVTLRTGPDGRFIDSYDFDDDVRTRLSGWVKCTVQLCTDVPGAPIVTKVVRWLRPSSDDLIEGLSALLADVRLRS